MQGIKANLSTEQRLMICELYRTGYALRVIAGLVKHSVPIIARTLREQGVELRSVGRPKEFGRL